MIVQFLNGNQLEYSSDLPFTDVFSVIESRAEELQVEVLMSNQIKLLQSETDQVIWYAFIRPIVEIPYKEVWKKISSYTSREKRHWLVSEYIQKVADEGQLIFSSSRGRYYEIFNEEYKCLSRVRPHSMSRREFNHPEDKVLHKKETIEDGKCVYNHWVNVNDEYFAISTIIWEDSFVHESERR